MDQNIQNFIDFLDNSPSCYHATDNLVKLLLENGYTQLQLKSSEVANF